MTTMVYCRFMEDHSKAALIWNYKTREELREALENEIRSFTVDKVSRRISVGETNYNMIFNG